MDPSPADGNTVTVVAAVTGSDRTLAVRLGGAMAVTIAVIGVAQVAIQPPPSSAVPLLYALIALYGVLGLIGLTSPEKIPDPVIAAAVLGGTLAIAAGMLAKGASSVDQTDNAMLFLIPVVYGAYFFSRRWSLIVVLLSSVSYGVVLTRVDAVQGLMRWLTSSVALGAVAGVVNALKSRDAERFGEVQDQAVSDPLTGLANRRALEHAGPGLIASGGASSLLLIDVDWFKEVNDTLGHDVGDEVLIRAARVLAAEARPPSMAVRLGGDEFVLLLADCRPQTATAIADAIRRGVKTESAACGAEVSVSIGVAASDGAAKLSELLRAADTALYRAKGSGRDTVRFAWVDSEMPAPARPPVDSSMPRLPTALPAPPAPTSEEAGDPTGTEPPARPGRFGALEPGPPAPYTPA